MAYSPDFPTWYRDTPPSNGEMHRAWENVYIELKQVTKALIKPNILASMRKLTYADLFLGMTTEEEQEQRNAGDSKGMDGFVDILGPNYQEMVGADAYEPLESVSEWMADDDDCSEDDENDMGTFDGTIGDDEAIVLGMEIRTVKPTLMENGIIFRHEQSISIPHDIGIQTIHRIRREDREAIASILLHERAASIKFCHGNIEWMGLSSVIDTYLSGDNVRSWYREIIGE